VSPISTGEVTISGSAVFDTRAATTGNDQGNLITQSAAYSLNVAASEIAGDLPTVFVVRGDEAIAGTIDASSSLRRAAFDLTRGLVGTVATVAARGPAPLSRPVETSTRRGGGSDTKGADVAGAACMRVKLAPLAGGTGATGVSRCCSRWRTSSRHGPRGRRGVRAANTVADS
jgi:hypothetical protein